MNNLNEDFKSNKYPERLNEFVNSIAQPQNKTNIVALQGIGEKVLNDLIFASKSNYYDELNEVLDTLSVQRLENEELITEFKEIQKDKDISASQYHAKLNQLLTDLRNRYSQVNSTSTKLANEFGAFDSDDAKSEFEYTNDNQAIIGIHLINKESYQMLGNFTELMSDWDDALYIYSRCANVDVDNLKPRVSSFRNGSVWAELIVAIGVASDIVSIYNAGISALQLYKDFKEFLDFRKKGIQMTAFGDFETGLDKMKNEIIEAIKNEAKVRLEKHEGSQSVEVGANAISNVIYGNIINGNNITLIDSKKSNKKLVEENQKLREKVRNLESNQELLEEVKLLVDAKLPKKDYSEIEKPLKKKTTRKKRE